jgi:hypothetical protein
MPRTTPREGKRQTRPTPEFFRDNIVIHTHIEKTAGTTLTRGLLKAFGRGRVWDIRSRQREKPNSLDAESRDSIFVLAGHFSYGANSEFFTRTPIHIACVRPPFQRFRSAYDFVRTRPDHPSYARVKDRTLAQAVEDAINAPERRRNAMARVLSGQANPDGGRVLEHIEKNYLIVSPSHRVNDTLNALIPVLGGGATQFDLHRNSTPDPSSEDIGDLRAQFEQINALDVQIVQFVEANYRRWLADLQARLSSLRRGDSP